MNNGPTLAKLLGLFAGTSTAISVALGADFGPVGVVTGVTLGALVGASTAIAFGSPRTARSGFLPVLAGLPAALVPILFAGLLMRGGSLVEVVSFGAVVLGLLGSLILFAAPQSRGSGILSTGGEEDA